MTYLSNLRTYAQRKGSAAAGAMSEIQCWRELARVSGVNSYQNMTKLQAMRAMLVKGGVSGSASMNEMVAMRKLANMEGCAPVEGLGMGPVMAALASPAQFIFNQEDGDGDSFLTVINSEKLALTGIPVGQVVHVTDGFVVSGAGEEWANGFWTARGDYDSHEYFNKAGDPDDENGDSVPVCHHGGPWFWEIANPNVTGTSYVAEQDTEYPWEATFNSLDGSATPPYPTLTHPAVQHYLGGGESDEANWVNI